MLANVLLHMEMKIIVHGNATILEAIKTQLGVLAKAWHYKGINENLTFQHFNMFS